MRIFTLLLGLSFSFCVVWALFIAPEDAEMGDAYRVIFVHVPAAFMSLLIYLLMAFSALMMLLLPTSKQSPFFTTLLRGLAPVGALMTLLALVTGSIWGHRMWGTWWTWHDARLVSELILLFLYLGYLVLVKHVQPRQSADKLGAILVIVGVINIPIIHFSVEWWTSLHQPPTLIRLGAPAIDAAMRYPLLAMIGCYVCYTLFCVILSFKLTPKIATEMR